MSSIEEKIAKLPKWAQDYIESKERTIRDLKSDLKLVTEGLKDESSPVEIEVGFRQYLHFPRKNFRVRFNQDYRHNLNMEVSQNEGNPIALRISGSGPLVVRPVASNVVMVEPNLERYIENLGVDPTKEILEKLRKKDGE